MAQNLKESGVPWLGKIPESWKIESIGALFQTRNEKVSDKDYPPLSVSKGGIVPQIETVAKTDANDSRKLVLKGDFVINSRSDRKQSCGVSPLDGSVSLINLVLYPKDASHITPSYANILMKNYGFAEEFYRWGHGIVADLWTTRWQEMKSILLPVPPLSKQERIVAYLDRVTGAANGLVENLKAQVEQLKRYKQSLISEVVTKGLNPNAKLKDSGVEWLGQIPETWGIKGLKFLFSFGKGLAITKADLTPEGIAVISYGQIHAKDNPGTSLLTQHLRYVPDSFLSSSPDALLQKNDIVFADTSEDYEGLGNATLMDREEQVFAGYHTLILRAKVPQASKFLAYLFRTDSWRSQLRQRATGIKVFSVTQRMLSACNVLLPPLSEQEAIVAYLDERCGVIDRLVAAKEAKIEKITAYRQALVYECVTGKREVC